jgi:putative SOS response-associated peptidase YedK
VCGRYALYTLYGMIAATTAPARVACAGTLAGLVSGDIHDRASVILEEGAWDAWLSGEPADASDVLKAAQEPQVAYYPVPKAVGSPKNDEPSLVERLPV